MSAASDSAARTGAPDLLGELNYVRARVRQQLGELIDVLDSDGGRYADHYAEHLIGPNARNALGTPKPPPSLAGPPAQLIRELVRDEATSVRLWGRAAA
jgi:hypothetical protein